ncbi:MAG: YDG domain-containing protein [Clostridia bacterium]|nr:YDG domain-containing protein [Clostridia bacterium]
MVDFVGNSNSTTVTVSGIDHTAPDAAEASTDANLVTAPSTLSAEAYALAYAGAAWWNTSTFTMEVDALSADDGEALIVYYYNVSYSKTGAYGTFTDLEGNTSSYPSTPGTYGRLFAVGNVAQLALDFSALSGSGYYMIGLQSKDLANNSSTYSYATRYIIKVDYDSPEYTVNLTKGTGSTEYISGSWATDQIKATITVTSRADAANDYHSETNLSGNMLSYQGADAKDHYVITSGGFITASDAFGTLTAAGTASASYTDGTLTITYLHGVFTIVCGDKSYIESEMIKYNNVDFTALFMVYLGPSFDTDYYFPTATDMAEDDPTIIFRSDRNNPMTPVISDDITSKLTPKIFNDFNIPADARDWYTTAWSMGVATQFSDDLLSNYSDEIKIYVGVNVNSFATGFTSEGVMAEYLLGAYASYGDCLTALGYFDGFMSVTASEIDGGGEMLVDFLESYGSGLRNVYVWVVDQANNTSAVGEYQALVDGNTYSIQVQIDAEDYGHFGGIEFATIEYFNSEGDLVTTFKRGEMLFINVTVANGFVPYKITQSLDGAAAIDIYTNNSLNCEYVTQDVGNIMLTMGGLSLEMAIDTNDISIAPPTQAQLYTFSFRKIVSLALGNTVVFYDGTQNEIDYVASIIDSEETFPGFPNSNFSEFVGTYYTSYTSAEDFVLTTLENGSLADGSAPKNVGLYTVNARVDGQFYVSEATVTSYRINKLSVNLTANTDNSDYGDEIALSATLGAVGDDIANMPDPISGSLALQDCASLLGVSAGSYNIVMGETLVYQNYDINYVSAIYTVNPKTVNITITESQSKQYGDVDPTLAYSVDEGQTLADEISAIILGGGIIRANGEDASVAGYEYSTSIEGFTLNPNYTLNIQSTDNFVITKRIITIIPLSSQSAVMGTEYEIMYNINSVDRIYLQYISGALSIDGEPVVGATNVISLSGLLIVAEMTNNLDLALSGTVTFTLIAPGDVVIIANANLNNSITFNDACPSDTVSTMFDFSSENFTVTGLESYPYYQITWEWAIGTYVAGNDVGNYLVDITNIFVYAGDDQASATDITGTVLVTMGNIFLEVNPAVISVAVSNSNLSRVYGSDEILLNYNITCAVGTSEDWNIVYGSFRRVICDAAGNIVSIGTRFDSTNAGLIANYGADYYYGAAIEAAFGCDSNFVIEYTNIDGLRFTVTPYQILLTLNSFNGKSREYNALTTVGYVVSDNAINFSKARTTDEVIVNFTANYNTADVAGSGKSIIFTALSLSGANSTNYVLYYDGTPVDGGTSVTITKMTADSLTNDIAVYSTELNLFKADVSVSKTYDGTTAISGSDISFLRGVLTVVNQNAITVAGVYPQAGIGTSLAVSVVITVALANANLNFTIATSEEENMSVTSSSSGLVITATLLNAEIIARLLTLDSFIISGVDKRYDSTSSAAIDYVYADGALGVGDTKANVATSFNAYFATLNVDVYDEAINAGEWTVILTGATLLNTNYTLSISPEDFAAYTTLMANILPTRLVLDITFDQNRQYDGTSAVNYTTTFDLKGYGDDHIDETELALLSFVLSGMIMSSNGVENTQVMFEDANKTIVALHNVLISGVTVTAEVGALLSNFILIGYQYNSGTSSYDEVEMNLGAGALADFEMVGAATLARKELDIQTSSITINDKYYDALSEGTGSINKDAIGIVEIERPYIGIQFSVQFTGVDVSASVKAYIRVQNIINEVAAGTIDYAANYKMKDNESIYAFGYAAIKQAPLTFDIALSNKVYDGTRNASISSYTLYGVIDSRDQGKYTLSYSFGAFSSINAGEVVTGSAYGLVLSYNGYTSGTGSYMNYVLTYAMTATEWETAYGETIPSETSNFYMTKTISDVETHYFTLESKQFTKLLSSLYDSEIYGFVYNTVVESTNTYYYVDYTGVGEFINFNGYEAAAGTISTKVVTVTAALTEAGQALRNKTYDGTTDFLGEEGTDYTVTISGICMGESVTIAENAISVKYDNANASAIDNDRVLIFSITGLSGENAGNYTFTGATARTSATIYRAVVDVSIDNIVLEYGDSARNYNISFDDNIHELSLVNGTLGYYGDHDNDPMTADQFIVLDPNIKLPAVVDNTNNFTNSGVYAINLTAGNSTNYTFNFLTSSYAGTTENGTPYDYQDVAGIITISKVVLYAYATDKYADEAATYEYMRIFRAANPAITLAYSSSLESNINGLKNGQTASGLISAGLFVEPVAKFMTFNTETGEWGAEVGTNAVVNASLVDSVYGVNINSLNTVCRNYIIQTRYVERYTQSGGSIADYFEQLYITYASIEGVSVKNVNVTYSGSFYTTNCTGSVSGDVITKKAYQTILETYDNNGTEATRYVPDYNNEIALNEVVNAGTYYIEITIKRTNYLDWVGGAMVTINPRKVSLGLRRLVVNYDGNPHNIIESRDVVIGDPAISANDITYIYKLNGVTLTQSNLPQNAGTYLVQACFNPQTATNTTGASNYAYSTSDSVALVINPIVVNIIVGTRQIIYDENSDNMLQYDAAVDSSFEGYDLPDINVFYRDSYSDSSVSYIFYAGNYSFTIKTSNQNYQLTGHTSGVFYVGIDSVVEVRDDDSAPRASATVKEGSLIYANTQLKYAIKSNNATNSTLWTQVNSNVSIIGTFFAPLETSAILDVSMITVNGDITNRIQPNGEVLLTMDLPKGAANGDKLYVVTAEGTLKELSYTYNSGTIVVTTDYVGYFVFVKEGSFPWWFVGAIGGAVVLGAVIAIIVIVQKKKKIKDAQLVTVGANEDGTPIQITVKEKREQEKLEEQNRIAEQKRQAEEVRLAEEKRTQELKTQNRMKMTGAAAQSAQPVVRSVMKAERADNISVGKMVNASKAVASDVASKTVKPGIMEALSVDAKTDTISAGKPAPSSKVGAPISGQTAQKPTAAPRGPQVAPPKGARPIPPRPQGAPSVGARPQGAPLQGARPIPPRPQGTPSTTAKPQPKPPVPPTKPKE